MFKRVTWQDCFDQNKLLPSLSKATEYSHNTKHICAWCNLYPAKIFMNAVFYTISCIIYSENANTGLPFRLHHESWMKSDGIVCPGPQKCFGCCYSYPPLDACTDCAYSSTLIISCSESTSNNIIYPCKC